MQPITYLPNEDPSTWVDFDPHTIVVDIEPEVFEERFEVHLLTLPMKTNVDIVSGRVLACMNPIITGVLEDLVGKHHSVGSYEAMLLTNTSSVTLTNSGEDSMYSIASFLIDLAKVLKDSDLELKYNTRSKDYLDSIGFNYKD